MKLPKVVVAGALASLLPFSSVHAVECVPALPVNLVSTYGAANNFCNPPGDCRLAYPMPDVATRLEIERYAASFEATGVAVPPRSRVTVCLPLGCATYGLSDNGVWAFGEFVAQQNPTPVWPVSFNYRF